MTLILKHKRGKFYLNILLVQVCCKFSFFKVCSIIVSKLMGTFSDKATLPFSFGLTGISCVTLKSLVTLSVDLQQRLQTMLPIASRLNALAQLPVDMY